MSAAPARELVIATANPGKLVELRALLEPLGVAVLGLDAFPEAALPEEGEAYEANAVAKARAAAGASGRPALGDDSGLEVDALGGAPGPRSARYGGPGLDDAGRCEKLLGALAEAGAADRSARFVCVAALATPAGEVATARGECPGCILEAPRGVGGFGYDPIFEVEGEGRAMAELAPEEKHRLSHRARAVRALADRIRAAAGGEGVR